MCKRFENAKKSLLYVYLEIFNFKPLQIMQERN